MIEGHRWLASPRGHCVLVNLIKALRLTSQQCPLLYLLLSTFVISSAVAEEMTTPGELILERPTLISLGFEWRIAGDENGNATCKVQYRKKGDKEYKDYLPLYRIGMGLKVGLAMICNWPTYTIPDALAGSIMDLEPGTDYEVRLEIQDPDGVTGEAVKTLNMKTRPEPVIPENAPVRHVYPPDYTGKKEKPAFRDIMHAINGFSPICDCYQTLNPAMAAKPGTVIKMHAGVHKYDNQKYWDFKKGIPVHSYWQHGTITLVARGTKEQPIYIIPAGDGEAVIDGNGCHNLFNLRSADYLHFEGLTIRGTDIAFHCGWQGLRGGGMKGLTVKNCLLENVVYGILAQDGKSEDFLISDNIILGRGPQKEMGGFGRSETGYAVNLAGQGHVVCHNYVSGFWDGINVFTSSHSDPQYGQQTRSIDFYNNDINNCADQFIESDGGYANLRMLRNRCFNCPSQSISSQPVHAGPVYWIGNILWRACKGRMNMKEQMFAQAYIFMHNTSSTHMRMVPNRKIAPEKTTWIIQNNIAIGPSNEGPPVLRLAPGKQGPKHISDYNAYRSGLSNNPWFSGKTKVGSLEEFQKLTGFEIHSILADYSVFTKADEEAVFAKGKQFVLPGWVDLVPAEGSPVIDAGTVIPGINDDFAGKAPDIGALEYGKDMPVYGPRSEVQQERVREIQRVQGSGFRVQLEGNKE